MFVVAEIGPEVEDNLLTDTPQQAPHLEVVQLQPTELGLLAVVVLVQAVVVMHQLHVLKDAGAASLAEHVRVLSQHVLYLFKVLLEVGAEAFELELPSPVVLDVLHQVGVV